MGIATPGDRDISGARFNSRAFLFATNRSGLILFSGDQFRIGDCMGAKEARDAIGAGRDAKPAKTEKQLERDAEQAREESIVRKGINERANALVAAKRGAPAFPWTEELEDEIIDRLANGQSFATICDLDYMPAASTILKRVELNASFRERYLRAREHLGAVLFDQCLQIADDDSNDVIAGDPKNGTESVVNHAAIARAKLRIETRFRMAGKFNVKFADRPERDAPVTVNHNTLQIDARTMDPEQRDQLRAMLIAARATTINPDDDK